MTGELYRRWGAKREARSVIALLWAAAAFAYFGWRLTAFNPQAFVFSVVFYAAELIGALLVAASLFVFWRAVPREAPAPASPPSVDVFIPTYDEPPEIVRLTAVAAAQMRCPHVTWLLDDGARPEIAAIAEEIGCRYLARADNTHAKAGNLNHALAGSRGDLVAVLDADHVPEPRFLETLLGYFSDPRVAYVQSPQDYYNTDSMQFDDGGGRSEPWHDQTLFYRIGQAGRDGWNAASFCGTSSIVRRRALEDIGGFATDTVTEDMHTAVRLQRRGWRSAYHPEPLAYGLAAADYREFLGQRLRWGHGNVQVLREERLPFSSGLSFPQRVCYTLLGAAYFESWFRMILYLTPASVLLTGLAPIGDTRSFFWFFVPYFALTWIAIESFGRGDARVVASERMALARLPAHLLATLGLLVRRRRFRVTSKVRAGPLPWYLPAPIVALLALNATALVSGAAAPPRELISAFSGGTTTVVLLWAAVNVALAAGVLRRIARSEDADATRPRFEAPLPVEMRNARAEYVLATLVSVRGDRVRVRVDPGTHLGPELPLRILLPGAHARGTLRVTGRTGGDVDGDVRWSDRSGRDALGIALRLAGWQRALGWPEKPLPRTFAWWRRRSDPGRAAARDWEAAALRTLAHGEEDWQFCLVRREGGIRHLLHFADLEGGAEIAIALRREGSWAEERARLAERPGGAAPGIPWPTGRTPALSSAVAAVCGVGPAGPRLPAAVSA